MNSPVRQRKPSWKALALALGIGVFSGPRAVASGDDGPGSGFPGKGRQGPSGPGCGTLGYGGPALYRGFAGFGLSYHRGYGYGGQALGVGTDGGYPAYGGPGYPDEMPRLRRFGRITPFPYFGGPGSSSEGHPNSFGVVGPLVVDRPVVEVSEPQDAGLSRGYGSYTGMLTYPDTLFAPYSAAAAATGSSSSSVNPTSPASTSIP